MSEPSSQTGPLGALEELDALLALAAGGPLPAADCLRMVSLLEAAPGRRDRVVTALARQRDTAAVDALLTLPTGTRGMIEGVFAALRSGVSRDFDHAAAPRMLALEFRSSTSSRFPPLVARAQAAFGPRLERLRVDGALHYRLVLQEGPKLRSQVRALELDLERLHRELLRIRGVRLWLNGWCLDDRSAIRPPARVPLLRGWLDWALAEDARA
ncbi:MAG: hypothetical protein KC431_29395 [Myxococcales bacterium]|nr:hypothetical protein [Myxococcales bacterium]